MARNRYFEDELLTYKFNKKSLRKMLVYIRPNKNLIITIGVIMLVMSFVTLLPSLLNGYIIDYVLTRNGVLGLSYVETGVLLFAIWLFVAALDTVYTYFKTVILLNTGDKTIAKLREDEFCHLQKLAFDYFDTRPKGKILVRLTSYIDEIANIFAMDITTLFIEILRLVFIVVWLCIVEIRLATIVIIMLVPMFLIVFFVRKARLKINRRARNKISNRTAYIAESIQGITVTKAFNRRELNSEIYDDLSDKANKELVKDAIVANSLYPLSDSMFTIALMLIYAAALYISTNGSLVGLSIGTFVTFTSLLGMVSGPLSTISDAIQEITVASTNLERVFELMETPTSIKDTEDAYDLPEIRGRVEYRDVTFSYVKGHPILEHINVDVPAGKMIALVGETGTGKTTMVSLLSRFYDVDSGGVFVDGNDVKNVKLHSLRSQIGVMMQDGFIFSGNILENIRYARPDATEEECIEAAKLAKAHDFIMKLPNGYHTETKEMGGGLSAGEIQLLSLARVVLTDPKILILDEATSNIDTETELLIKEAFDVILKGRTSFVIAHRLSTIRKADCILFLKGTGIVEAGTHDELMAKKGHYYNLLVDKE